VTISRGRCPPPPPPGFASLLETVKVAPNPEPWCRIFWEGRDPLGFVNGKRTRFDPLPAPWQDTKVLYAGTSFETAVAETILRWHGQIVRGEEILISEVEQLYPRRVARFVSTRPLTVIDATGLGLAQIEGAVTSVLALPTGCGVSSPKPIADDIFNCGAIEYEKTQGWGAWFRAQHPQADGIQWVSRQYNVGRCLVLFEDLCGTVLEQIAAPVPLYEEGSTEREVVRRLIGQLGWGVG